MVRRDLIARAIRILHKRKKTAALLLNERLCAQLPPQ